MLEGSGRDRLQLMPSGPTPPGLCSCWDPRSPQNTAMRSPGLRSDMDSPRRGRRSGHALLPALMALLGVGPALAQEPVAAPSGDSSAAPTAAASPWAGSVELYGFLPKLDSSVTVRGFSVDSELQPGQVLNHLQSAFSARASVEKDRLGLLLDVAYNQLGSEPARTTRRGLLTGRAEITAINGVYDLALRWRLGERESAVGRAGQGWLIPYAGLRVVQARLDVAAQLQGNGPLRLNLQRQGSLDRTWAQPLVGLQGSLFVAPRLRLFARGDAGGFGLAGAEDFSANAQAGVGYALGNSTDLNVSWRYQTLRWNNGAQRSNGFSNDLNGIELGLKVYF